jgi:hypothetical protein
VVAGRSVAGARWVLGAADRRWVLEPLGLEVLPIGVSPAELNELQLLIDDADAQMFVPPAHDGVVAADASPGNTGGTEFTEFTELTGSGGYAATQPPHDSSGVSGVPGVPAAALDWSLMVRLLGPVEVVDGERQPVVFERSKALELVAWLSQHRDRSTRMGARTALWETNVRDSTFANVVSDARRSLARLVEPADGDEWIGRTLTDDLPLHRAVVTDADVLADSVRRAAACSPTDAIAVLTPALSLVRDIPFSGTAYLWPDGEGITSELILLVTSAATVLAGHHLTLGDVAGVFWATGQGLKVLPGHEELISLRMRAYGRQGDLAGVRHEWESYERVLDAETWSDGSPSPKLVALRRELLAPSLSDA